MKTIPYEQSDPCDRDETCFYKIASLGHNVCLVYMFFHFTGSSKVTRVYKAVQQLRTIQVYVPPCWFCFLTFIPVDRAEISYMSKDQHAFVSVTEPARFLNTRKGKTMSLINHFFNLSKEKRKRMFRLGETFWRWPQFVNGFPELCL